MGISREKLYDEVWAEPATTVAKRYEVSSTFLARVCDRLRVPRPPRGYWAQREFGKAPPRPPLPDARPGDEVEWSRDGTPPQIARGAPPPSSSEPNTAAPITPTAPRPSRGAHPLLAGAEACFEKTRETIFSKDYLRPYKRKVVDLIVSKQGLPRALDAARKLFRGLEDRGHAVALGPAWSYSDYPRVRHLQRRHLNPKTGTSKGEHSWDSSRWRPDRPTLAYIGEVAIGLTLYEIEEAVLSRWDDDAHGYVPVARAAKPVSPRLGWHPGQPSLNDLPTGRFGLRVYSPDPLDDWERVWKESKRGQFGSLVPEIVESLEHEAPLLAARVEEAKRREEEQRRQYELEQRELARQAAERRQAKALQASKKQLADLARAWADALALESFFAAMVREAGSLSEEQRQATCARIERARQMLGGTGALPHFRAWRPPEEQQVSEEGR